MNKTEFRLKILYPIYCFVKKAVGSPLHLPLDCKTEQEANPLIFKTLLEEKPVMICRMGSLELETVTGFINKDLNWFQKQIRKLHRESIGFNARIRQMICDNAGFFPADEEHLTQFCELMLDCMKDADILGCWRPEEIRVRKYFKSDLKTIILRGMEPFFCPEPWTKALQGKKVLVIHPFIDSILKQYKNREKLFQNPDILPDFDLKTVRAVQSIGGKCSYSTWFDALKHMEDEISSCDFDIALIGAGAYGFPLASHVKHMGKKAVHMGGVLQMLFGIYGNRWKDYPCINEFWIRPSAAETPATNKSVENSCYW